MVETPTTNLTSRNISRALAEVLFPDMLNILPFISEVYKPEHPGVDIFCAYSSGIPTIKKLKYKGHFTNSSYDSEYGDGDGTVHIESLKLCDNWIPEKDKTGKILNIHSMEHVSIMSSKPLLEAYNKYISGHNPANKRKRFIFIHRHKNNLI